MKGCKERFAVRRILSRFLEKNRRDRAKRSLWHKVIVMIYVTTDYKTASYKKDEFEEHLGIIVSVVIEGYSRTVAGKLVELSESFVTLEHRDGRRSKIRRRDIALISPVPIREAL